MLHNRCTLIVCLALTVSWLPLYIAREDDDEVSDDERYSVDTSADQLANQVIEQVDGPQLPDVGPVPASPAPAVAAPVPSKEQTKVDAINAHQASEVAKQAAKVANKVATHSKHIAGHARKALKHALGALHDARVESKGLGSDQKDSLKKAEAHLREATKKADHGELKNVKDAQDIKKEKMQADLDKKKGGLASGKGEKEAMRKEIRELRKKLKAKKQDDKDIDTALDDLEKSDGAGNDEQKAELERLREQVDQLEEADEGHVEYEVPAAKPSEAPTHKVPAPEDQDTKSKDSSGSKEDDAEMDGTATPVEAKGIDIDTAMPYGELEPFGREDTAQELTEQSISESDEMVDQLERAEVAEEKRSVFRALTRLRGAAITSFDGVARSQTGNIDEYNKVHQWRQTHPLHHLADEESDVSKWAFPDNAD